MEVTYDGTLWGWQCSKTNSSSYGMFLWVLQKQPTGSFQLQLSCFLLITCWLLKILSSAFEHVEEISLIGVTPPSTQFVGEGSGIQSSFILPLSHVIHIWSIRKTHTSLSYHVVDKRAFFPQGSPLFLCSTALGQSVSSFSCHPDASRL